jgi:hypothetical protein
MIVFSVAVHLLTRKDALSVSCYLVTLLHNCSFRGRCLITGLNVTTVAGVVVVVVVAASFFLQQNYASVVTRDISTEIAPVV